MAKIVTATIDLKTAEVEVDLAGYKGKGCHALQDVFSQALGGKTIAEKKKPEFNSTVTNVRNVSQ